MTMKSGMAFPAALAAVMLVSAACGGEYDDDLSIGSLTSELRGGYVTVDCGWPEDVKLRDAHNVLFDTITIGYSDFLACMSAAPSVEFICHNALNPVRTAQSLRSGRVYTTIKCRNLRGANGSAYANIRGNNLNLDRNFINTNTPRRIASVIAHEIMHNRGYLHSVNDFGSRYYPNTIPEQIEACVLYGVSNRTRGPKAVTWDSEYCNGPRTGNQILRNGMHACPLGQYMAGVRLDHNEFMCSKRPGYTYAAYSEIIRYPGGNIELGMANCPRGYAMTGFHESKGRLLCAPYRTTTRYRDTSTRRAGMHTCPQNMVMTGIHVSNTWLTCQR